ncbi:unnamed protein product [Rotaria socialis]|uniref:Exocyst complex component Sec8 n=1 Tax=Rotaria socialis TaxID=392032 RepID=A0A820XW60_9BILA|nr:unnamed protein product [Rotaria socialis]
MTPFTSGYTSRSLKQNHHQYERLKLSRVNLEILSNAMKTTLTLSYDILLVLFLEIRLHCFYHLSLLFRNASHYASVIDADPDENIMTLNRDLTRLQETLHSALNEKKFSFLFQGFGFALATILIRSAPRFIHISETGVTKMCRNIFAIEQTLTQIRTVGDAELMRVNRYCEFLHATRADEILAIIEEHRSEYTEHDYIYLLQLKHLGFPANTNTYESETKLSATTSRTYAQVARGAEIVKRPETLTENPKQNKQINAPPIHGRKSVKQKLSQGSSYFNPEEKYNIVLKAITVSLEEEWPTPFLVLSDTFPNDTQYIHRPLYALIEITKSKVECNLTSLQSNLLPIPLMEQTFQINITDVLPEDMRPKSNRMATLSIKRCALPLVPAYCITTH